MNIYEPAVFSGDERALKHVASRLAAEILPLATPLAEPIDQDPVRMLLRQKTVLIEFYLYARPIGEEEFAVLLERTAQLEVRRREEHDPTLAEISICLVACDFSENFLSRVPFDLIRVGLFQWLWIRSAGEGAVLVRPVTKLAIREHSPESLFEPETVGPSSPQGTQVSPRELSTAEWIALGRLGMELRSRP